MTDCPTCQQLTEDVRGAEATLTRMRRSAMVWDYRGQIQVVDERHAALTEHRVNAHPSETDNDHATAPRAARPPRWTAETRRRVVINVVVGGAVGALVLVTYFLHVA